MNIVDTVFALIDTETLGKDPADPANEVIEVAVHLHNGRGDVIDCYSSLIRPTRPVPPESSAIHHLVDEDLVDAPTRAEVDEQIADFIPDGAVPVAHHAEFDRAVLANEGNGLAGIPWLCSERLAHHITPEAPAFKLQVLRYYYGFKHLDLQGLNPHRAAADLFVLAPVFFHLVARYRAWAEETCAGDESRLAKAELADTLTTYAASPYAMDRPPFGKHKTWDDLLRDRGYTKWMLGLPDLSTDVRWNIEREMRRRKAS